MKPSRTSFGCPNLSGIPSEGFVGATKIGYKDEAFSIEAQGGNDDLNQIDLLVQFDNMISLETVMRV